MARPFTIAATGDALMTMHVAETAAPGFREVIDLLRAADARFTTLEGTLHAAGRAIVERVGRLSPEVGIEWDEDGFGQVRW